MNIKQYKKYEKEIILYINKVIDINNLNPGIYQKSKFIKISKHQLLSIDFNGFINVDLICKNAIIRNIKSIWIDDYLQKKVIF